MSVFSDIPQTLWVAENPYAFAIRDRFPVSHGHTLIITKRVTPTWFDATPDERAAVLALIDVVKGQLDAELHPDGYNIGFNVGDAAGQTVPHLHVHVIPRYRGDMDDPRGGVRHVIPSRGNYLREVPPLATGGERDPFAKHILPLFETATEVAIVAAFVQESGLARIAGHVHAALARGVRLRVLTGDYLDITQASALKMLLNWQRASEGRLEARVVETRSSQRAFHPKSYRFEAERFGIAFVGSSNLSRSALEGGIEWNLRVDRDRDRVAYERVREAFDAAWLPARVLDEAWVDDYARRARLEQRPLPQGEVEAEPMEPLPSPHRVQEEALEQLRYARDAGRRRALVVLATGLGKTALAAFDYQQLRESLGRRPRLLFLAHRRELLRQASETYRRLLRDQGDDEARITWFSDDQSNLNGELVFASVAKLARTEHLDRLHAMAFDYVVVDEVHHAAADSYRRILSAIDPGFLLGLTATPDRADAADVLGLFDDHIAYRADVGRGVAIGRLVPFHYFGVKDEIDYTHIPWRNKRFDPEALAAAAQTSARMDTMWRAWNAHPGTRTLVFCCSIEHAKFVRDWLRERNVETRAVFSGEGSDNRDDALDDLRSGVVSAVCSVDVFNEGVDVPSVDRVVMLRPTESSVIFLQQLGRGLRASEGKDAVTVVDFVGNHRVFLERVRTLLSLAGGSTAAGVREFLSADGAAELPAGCSVDLEIEAKELLSRLFRIGGADEVERAYRELRDEREQRPTAGELQRMGYLPSKLRDRHGSWFDFVHAEGDLAADERAVRDVAGAFLREVETTEMTRSFKMVMLEALLDAGLAGAKLSEVAARSHAILRRAPELWADVAEASRTDDGASREWLAYWRKNPVAAWTTPKAQRRTWFKLADDRVALDLAIDPALAPTLARLTYELVDYRLAQYRARHRQVSGEGFTCKAISNQRDPILKLPSRATARELPEGEVDVRLPDGAVWQFRFAKEFINVARPAGTQANKLPDLLRNWFGPSAGQRGTSFEVRFSASPDGLWITPSQTNVIDLAERRGIVAYPDLHAAAGHAPAAIEAPDAERVMLPLDSDDPELFAVRVAGTSMDGGKRPMRDGDWAVMRLMRGGAASALDGRVILAEVPSAAFGSRYHLKRLVHRDGRWALVSDNPDGPTIEINKDTTQIARVERVVRPEDLAPAIGTLLRDDELAERFGVAEPVSGRHEGHLFVFVDRKGILEQPDRVRFVPDRVRPSETAYVLAKQDDGHWRYRGVARDYEDGLWRIPDVDFATWRLWGEGRSASRALPEGALARAQVGVDALLVLAPEQRWIEQGGRRARILGAAQRGGLRVDGGDGGFRERTVSLTDVAWVVVADDDVRANGGVLDEERVNRARYLEGTPKESTRWIDSGWAIAAWLRAKPWIREVVASASVLERQVRRRGGKQIDATFRVEPVGDALSVVIESRGGTRGSAAERNVDYNEGFELILERLGAAGMQITDAVIDSSTTDALEHEQRRLQLGQAYPIAITDAAALRRAMSKAQPAVGRRAGARGAGNATRRVRLFVAPTGAMVAAEKLVAMLAGDADIV